MPLPLSRVTYHVSRSFHPSPFTPSPYLFITVHYLLFTIHCTLPPWIAISELEPLDCFSIQEQAVGAAAVLRLTHKKDIASR